jgi:prophage maintenance system killer protein
VAARDGEPIGWLAALADAVRQVHARAIRLGGGMQGEYPGRLESVCGRPFQSAFGEGLYPSTSFKAAALFHGIIAGHPFADGNKRTASLMAVTLLTAAGFLEARPTSLQLRLVGEVAIETALPGSMSVEEIAFWLERILGPRA